MAAGTELLDEKELDAWNALRDRLPWRHTMRDRQLRRGAFNRLDTRGNGFVSVAQAAEAVAALMGQPQSDAAGVMSSGTFREMVLVAFGAVKSAAPADAPHSDDLLTPTDFRLLLRALYEWLQACLMFERAPLNEESVSLADFRRAAAQFAATGANIDVEECHRDYHELRYLSGNVHVPFSAVCEWLMRAALESETDEP
eukprot:TRINITY_DN25298_c0_g1_i1.p2 TRINITY_DN25298_c0_g1~~TRINITY_DN25298_c0_g1_i1.p2  ORF type:complete len:215 (+),score=95.76 TRINITY_DN25298_c0_g1_i1:51-647(+)